MNNEIKEINIKMPGQILDYVDTKEHLLELFNYITNLQTIEQQYSAILSENAELENKITNLQEENERLKEITEEHKNCTRKHWQQKCAEHCANEIIYKSRIDEAIEILKLCNSKCSKEVINILNGDDEE